MKSVGTGAVPVVVPGSGVLFDIVSQVRKKGNRRYRRCPMSRAARLRLESSVGPLSLAPDFSRVIKGHCDEEPFQRFPAPGTTDGFNRTRALQLHKFKMCHGISLIPSIEQNACLRFTESW